MMTSYQLWVPRDPAKNLWTISFAQPVDLDERTNDGATAYIDVQDAKVMVDRTLCTLTAQNRSANDQQEVNDENAG